MESFLDSDFQEEKKRNIPRKNIQIPPPNPNPNPFAHTGSLTPQE